jgi:Tol biopolymer transport system component
LAIVLLASAVTAAQAAFPGKNGKIAVGATSQVDRYEFHFNIYVVNPDGSGSTALTSDNASYTPAWSPDGSKIAFGSDRGGNSGVYTMNADGSGATRLTTDPAVGGLPAWSPDGSKIAFVKSGDIYTMNADGSGFTQITASSESSDSRPSWSPRGNEIAFQRSHWDPSTAETRTAIYLVDTDGTDVRQLVADHAGSPDWSPDGSKIAFSNNYWGGIWVVNVDAGTAPVRLTYDSPTTPEYVFAYDGAPAWSPDGTRVAFSRVECPPGYCGSSQLLLINADGTGTEQVSYGNSPDWQPLPGPQRSDYKNASHFCKALREFLGDEAFRNRYGGGANAHGKCVSGDRR